MEAVFSVEAWQSPVGLGIFLVCLGVFFRLILTMDKDKKDK